MLVIKPKDENKKFVLTPEERANVLNALDETLSKFGLETASYDDSDGVFFDVKIRKK